MRTNKNQIRVTADSVDVEWGGPYRSVVARFFFGTLFVATALYLLYGPFVGNGRDPSLSDLLLDARSGKADLIRSVCPVILIVAMAIFFFAAGVRHFLPFGEQMHCDSSTLTWAKIPWVSFGNRWVTRSTPLAGISRAHYGIAYTRKGGNLYGVLLKVGGKVWKLFAGIKSPEAHRILDGLKAFGISIQNDPE